MKGGQKKMKVENIEKIEVKFQMNLEGGSPFYFKAIWANEVGEWVLQGETIGEAESRYTEAELKAIAYELKKLNTNAKKKMNKEE